MILTPDQSAKKTLLGRVSGNKVVPLAFKKSKPYGVSPRNVGQYFMQEALMADADTAPLVIIKGMAGTAKTFYSLAVGMEKVYNNPTKEYRRDASYADRMPSLTMTLVFCQGMRMKK